MNRSAKATPRDLPAVRFVTTSAGRIAVREAGPADGGVPLLFVHGNSLSSRSFRSLFEHRWTERRNLIAIDLPGHGESDWAEDPDRIYTTPGWARALGEVCEALALSQVVLIGHSLGGHVALEASPAIRGLRGLVAVGMAPVFPGFDVGAVFHPDPVIGFAFEASPSGREIEKLHELWFGGPDPSGEARADFVRTDPAARPRLLASALGGEIADERELLRACPVAVALVLGGDDRVVRAEALLAAASSSVWRAAPVFLSGSSHTPWAQDAEGFVALVETYLAELGL